MTLEDFNTDALDQRAKLVDRFRCYLSTRKEISYSIRLFHMGEFFAEVWLSHKNSKVVLVHGFDSKALLTPYLKLIQLTDLMSED
ncbi:hypothetical protein CLV24_14010 [Pontibacter ummariensis]|uniref:Uncharacterized protein n=1 Tax=Pontibacter ummariensis TaxID=1610492 RepID=A0A239LEH9_9BACT|nr:hypothetical protein [Pontibacter ummariensis]PRY03634.1 hypothetical protein CLV24_14010 [Pontibacter ummariensis]SNT28735.1 hypothetical protein SAMN06296052_14010 [Pontibacter ummariensis]